MERIAEVTETVSSSSSESGSIPQTQVEVLDFRKAVVSPTKDKEKIWEEQVQNEQSRGKDEMIIEDEHNNSNQNKDIKQMTLKRSKKEKKRTRDQKMTKSTDKSKRRAKEVEEFCAEHKPPPVVDEEVLSTGSPCDCPAHVHDRESPLKIAEVTLDFNKFKLKSFVHGCLR